MSTAYQLRSAAVQNEIISADFYTRLYLGCLKQRGMTQVDVEKKLYPNAKLNALWEDFWWQLPDSPSIRSGPFFLVCDLCEDIDMLEDLSEHL